ncbi:MAG: nucleotidyltransferase family protein [Pseudomonadota bacterium]
MKKINKGMVLAAGLGTRMRPLTFETPKALLPIGEKRLIDFSLERLSKGGIKHVIVNLHHLGEQIRAYLGSEKYGMKIAYSEEPEILGTGGGIKNAVDFFEGADFVVTNCDLIMDVDLKEVIQKHESKTPAATLVVKRLTDGESYTPIDIDNAGEIKSFGKGEYFYTGLQILSQKVLDILPPKGIPSCLVNDGFKKLLSEGKILSSYFYDGRWIDIGDLQKYQESINN